MQEHKCTKENAIDAIRDDVREIRSDVKKLIATTSGLRIKASGFGALAGLIPFVIWYLTKGIK